MPKVSKGLSAREIEVGMGLARAHRVTYVGELGWELYVSADQAAHVFEAVEEAGLTLGALLPVAGYYPTPGISAEFLYSYVAVTDLPDGAAGVFGVEGEAEDIRGHLIGFDDLMALVASGEVSNAPLIMTAFWLQARRAELRGG